MAHSRPEDRPGGHRNPRGRECRRRDGRPAAVLGGPLSVTAVSLWELRRLRSRHGLTLRTALGR
ncbi:hypothetical protein [Streptomyces sp. ML-6]|uniref:hypothetical protein n=1 Tax=Streptomyces sp. ML-6 TaxID=2982693 RepID=UPI0024C0E65A|nr:hypothetical protein [Streptomyces sp. ML-6]MDK0521767.1 hypothetical protein [Streptomyces sp. ML-6]